MTQLLLSLVRGSPGDTIERQLSSHCRLSSSIVVEEITCRERDMRRHLNMLLIVRRSESK